MTAEQAQMALNGLLNARKASTIESAKYFIEQALVELGISTYTLKPDDLDAQMKCEHGSIVVEYWDQHDCFVAMCSRCQIMGEQAVDQVMAVATLLERSKQLRS